MADFANQTITVAGRKMLATALAEKRIIHFRTVAIGDGQAPEAPENLTALVSPLFELGVGQVYKLPEEPGVWCVSASFVATSDKGNFYCREAGIYATFEDEEDTPETRVLFAYLNAGETADYIRSVSAKSKTQIDLNFCLVVGAAEVLYVYDPDRPLTLKALQDLEGTVTKAMEDLTEKTNQKMEALQNEVDESIKSFTDESIKTLQEQQKQLLADIDAAKKELAKATEGFVLKAGDTMTGKLTISTGGLDVTAGSVFVRGGGLTVQQGIGVNTGGITVQQGGNITLNGGGALVGNVRGDVTGNLTGSATMWNGWTNYDSLSDLSLSETTATIPQIVGKMATPSMLMTVLTQKNANMPENVGMLEIRKNGTSLVNVLFTAFTGNAYVGVVYNNNWTGWKPTTPIPAGFGGIFWGAGTVPIGWLLCNGATLQTSQYPALFAAIGYTHGGSGSTFKLPDSRGQFVRGYDEGRGLDKNRKMGTDQQSAAPNIVGEFDGNSNDNNSAKTGAFYLTTKGYWGSDGDKGGGIIGFDASRVSGVYQNGVTEVRPSNIVGRYIVKY